MQSVFLNHPLPHFEIWSLSVSGVWCLARESKSQKSSSLHTTSSWELKLQDYFAKFSSVAWVLRIELRSSCFSYMYFTGWTISSVPCCHSISYNYTFFFNISWILIINQEYYNEFYLIVFLTLQYIHVYVYSHLLLLHLKKLNPIVKALAKIREVKFP